MKKRHNFNRFRTAISRSAVASVLALTSGSVIAAPAVFFNDDIEAGKQTFIDTVTAADAAYNAANPGATQQSTVFAFDITNSTGSTFSVTQNGQTVYVVSKLAGNNAPNNRNGDEGNDGFTSWGVNYVSGDFNNAISQGYSLSFYSDAALTTSYNINAVGLMVTNWGTCCTANNTKPDGSTANASEIYMLFNGSTPLLVGGISQSIGGEEHFVAAIDDSNSFSSVTMVPNGRGEAFGAGAYLLFSNVQINSVPAGSSVVTVGGGATPDIDDTFSVTQLQTGQVNPAFAGGTLTAGGSGSVNSNFTINGAGGTINTNGNELAITGALNNASGAQGSLTKTGNGILTLSGQNNYTGQTVIASGTLALLGNGSIANSSGVAVEGIFDISGTTSGAAVSSLTGNGEVALGSRRLSITNAQGGFDGDINGSGGLDILAGNMTLSGTNGFSGGLVIDNGSQVEATNGGSLGTGAVTIRNGTLRAGANMILSNTLELAQADAVFDTGANQVALTGVIDGGTLNKTGSGTLVISGNNAHAATVINGGRLVATTAQALGSTAGSISIGENSNFTAGGSLAIDQVVRFTGTGAVFDTGANNVMLSGGSTGTSCLIKEGSGLLTLNGPASNAIGACVQQGTLSFNNVFDGQVWVEATGTAGGSGRINGDVEVLGTLAPGNSPGILEVAGSVTQLANSTYAVDIDGPTAGNGAGFHDALVLIGANSVYTANGTIQPVLRNITGSATNSFTPAYGSRFEVVVAEGGVAGTYDGIVQPSEGLPANSRFDVIYNNNSIELYVTPNSFGEMFGNRGRANLLSVGNAIDRFRSAPGTRNSEAAGLLLNGLYRLDSNGLARALTQLSGEIYADSMDSALRAQRFSQDAVSDRLNLTVDTIDPETPTSNRIWGTISNHITNVASDTVATGYRASAFNIVIGADRAIGSDGVLGAAFGYGRARTHTGHGSSAKAHTYQGIVYGRYDGGSWYANGMLAASTDRYRVARTVDLASGAVGVVGKGSGSALGADLEAGYKLFLADTLITPFAGMKLGKLTRNPLTETGAASIALTLDEDTRNLAVARLGTRVNKVIETGGTRIIPSLSVLVDHEMSRPASVITPTLHGEVFRVSAAKPARTSFQVGGRIDAELSPAVALNVSYRYGDAGRTDTRAVTGGVSIRW